MVIDKLAVLHRWYEPEGLTFERILIFVHSFSILTYLLNYLLTYLPSYLLTYLFTYVLTYLLTFTYSMKHSP